MNKKPGGIYSIRLFSFQKIMNKIKLHGAQTSQSGMTLIELVVVVLIISILIAVGSAQISSTDDMTLAQQARKLSSQIRHAQFLAANWGCDIQLTFTSNSYEATSKTDYTAEGKTNCGAGNVIVDPAIFENFSITLESPATFSSSNNIYFDSVGRPRNVSTNVLLTNNTVYDLTSGTKTWRCTVSPITGFVSLVAL